MQTFAMVCSVSLLLMLTPSSRMNTRSTQAGTTARQLAAVRGEIVKVTVPSRGMLLITVRPAREFPEVIILARDNDLVGTAVGRSGEPDLLGLLSGDARDEETITAAELNEGDVISVIFDPRLQNRALEIYLH